MKIKNQRKLGIVITGSNGKIGSELIKQSLLSKYVLLKSVICKKNSIFSNLDVSNIIGGKPTGIIVKNNINQIDKNFDILIDFSAPKATLEYLNFCYQNKKNIVIGTTGFNTFQINEIKTKSNKIGIVLSYNFSTYINLIFNILEKFKFLFCQNSNVEIIEKHHMKKKDIPSGTSLEILKILNKVYKKESENEIKKSILKIQSIRTNTYLSEHKIQFENKNELIQIKHKILNKKIFAIQAIKAALWVSNKNTGIFNMQDILNIKNL